jgi:hypothetical protein
VQPTPICLGSGSTVSRAINGTYTGSPKITVTPNLANFPYTITTNNGSQVVTPTTLGNYQFALAVQNVDGSSNTCAANLTVQDCTLPIPGTLQVEKNLISPAFVTSTGEAVTWKLVVTASGAAVKDFEIRDTLPKELSYSGYTLVVPAGITVAAPTVTPLASGETLITWKVNGTLQVGGRIEITLVSTVAMMPNPSAKNVVCVRDDKGDNGSGPLQEIDCDDDSISKGGTPNLWLRKRFSDGSVGPKTYKIGDSVEYRIDF